MGLSEWIKVLDWPVGYGFVRADQTIYFNTHVCKYTSIPTNNWKTTQTFNCTSGALFSSDRNECEQQQYSLCVYAYLLFPLFA